MDTDQEEYTKEQEVDNNAEEKNSDEEDDHDLAHGKLVETEVCLYGQSEQAKVEQMLRESCSCQLRPHVEHVSTRFPKRQLF